MVKFGYFLSSEECGPRSMVEQAKSAAEAGFDALWISDHYHPWNDAQGQSPFVWSTIAAVSQVTSLPVTTAVTCPIMRIHPAIIAQAAATSAVLLEGRFVLGLGTGEALNEHILGDPWPEASIRQDMLEEAIDLMRELWTGKQISRYGEYFDAVNARIYTLPDSPPPVYVSGFGPNATRLAGQIADGFITVMPDAEAIELFRSSGGQGKPVQAGTKVCWADDRQQAAKTVHRLWANQLVPGQLSQELPTPALFEQASELVTEQMIAESPTPLGPDIDEHVDAITEYVKAGADEVYIGQIGPEYGKFFEAYRTKVLPKLRAGA